MRNAPAVRIGEFSDLTGIAAAIGLFLAREPIIEATGRFLDGREAKKTEKKRRNAAAKAAAGRPRSGKIEAG